MPSNIAEGHARGSVAELESQLLLSIRFGYLAENDVRTATKNCEEIGKMLHVLQWFNKRFKSLPSIP